MSQFLAIRARWQAFLGGTLTRPWMRLPPAMRLTRLLALAVPLLIAASAGPAQAGIHNPRVGLGGLNAANGASWVREYAFATGQPTMLYAATEDDGVWRSPSLGLKDCRRAPRSASAGTAATRPRSWTATRSKAPSGPARTS
jgi:hypothetical protein